MATQCVVKMALGILPQISLKVCLTGTRFVCANVTCVHFICSICNMDIYVCVASNQTVSFGEFMFEGKIK